MPFTHRQFRDVAIGIVLVWLDLRFGGIDILPDLLGYALMALGLARVARAHLGFALAMVIAVVLGLDKLYAMIVVPGIVGSAIGIGGLPLLDTDLARFDLTLHTAVVWTLDYAYTIAIASGLRAYFAGRGDMEDSDRALRLRQYFIYSTLFMVVAVLSALALPMLAAALLMPPLVSQIALTVSLCSLLFRGARPPQVDSFLAHLIAPEPPSNPHIFAFWGGMPTTGRFIVGGTLVAYMLAVWWYLVPCSWLDMAVSKSGCIALFEQQGSPGAGIALSPDGRFVVSNEGGNVRQREIASGQIAHEWSSDRLSFASGVAISPDGTTIAAAQRNGIDVWRAGAALSEVRFDADDGGGARTIAFAPDGASFAAANDNGVVVIWRTADGGVLHTLRGLDAAPLDVQFSARGTLVAASERRIAEWRTDDGTSVQILDLPQFNRALAIADDGTTFAIVNNGAIEQRSVGTGELVRRFNLATGGADATLAFSRDGSMLAVWSAADSAPIVLYHIADGMEVGTIRVPGAFNTGIRELGWSADNRLLAVSGFTAWRANDHVGVWRVP